LVYTIWLGLVLLGFVAASAPEAVARTTASPNATLANMAFPFWLAWFDLLTERFSQYSLPGKRSMTERFGHNFLIGVGAMRTMISTAAPKLAMQEHGS
jgi:hypothetical protein